MLFVGYMGTLEPYDLVAERFGIAKSAAFNVVKRVGFGLLEPLQQKLFQL